MATKSKKASKKKPLRPLKPADPAEQYVELRTLLDSLEIGALRYYLDHTSPSTKNERFKIMEPLLREVIALVWRGEKLIPCPPGYTSCNGACVPYNCYFED